MLLMFLSVIVLWSAPAYAEVEHNGPCLEDPRVEEIHTPPPGTDTTNLPRPIVTFCAEPREGCDSLTVAFTDLSVGYISEWTWDFGDPASGSDNISHDEYATHFYSAPGSYTVTLTVTGPGGTSSRTAQDYIVVRSTPTADFVANVREGCAPLTVDFEDRSTGGPTWWRWDFGDGGRDYHQNASHTYTAPGEYDVALKVLNDCGKDSVVKRIYIRVKPGPTADFTADVTQLCAGGTVAFTDLSRDADSRLWDFGDGTTSTDQHPGHVYPLPGIYTVTLTATNECGSDVAAKTEFITVLPSPIADFTSDVTSVCKDGPVTFTDLSQHASTWAWDFGDGSTSTDPSPVHTYAATGSYTVSLMVTNLCGEDEKTVEHYITVVDPPIADFEADPVEACFGTPVHFTDLSQNAVSWTWTFGDGTTSTGQHPQHTYATGGVYTVSLTVTNACGPDTETKTEYITIHPGPTADFTADPTNICVGGTVEFTDMSDLAETWDWSFGDGNTAAEQNPSHTYTSPGTYTVILTVSNDCGQDVESKLAYITVQEPPTADFEADLTEICEGGLLRFTSLGTGATGWVWDFGDGTGSSDENPSHTYPDAGLYSVSLTVTNSCGQDEEIKTNYIYVQRYPVADFEVSSREVCLGEAVTFTNLSTDEYLRTWDFGDGDTSHAENPVHSYYIEGLYTVTLTVGNDCGDDVETRAEYIRVVDSPIAEFVADPTDACTGATIQFTDQSRGATSWSWKFGDGTTSTDQNPTHVYTGAGVYRVSLTVSNACGSDVRTRDEYITIGVGPIADFRASTQEACVGEMVTFTNLSSNATTSTWDFGDGVTSTDPYPIHTYRVAGQYSVRLTVTNDCGQDEEYRTQYITVYEHPVADFEADKTDDCEGNEITFTDLSSYATSWFWSFGDGQTSSNPSPSHQYTGAGVFTVTLTVTNICGSDTATKVEYVTVHPKPVAAFTADLTDLCVGGSVAFTDLSTYAETWHWDFGDGTTSVERHPVHAYAKAGVYDVTLFVDNDCGEDDEIKFEYIAVHDGPTADFSAVPTSGNAPLDVVFSDLSTSTSGITSWSWNFGDGTSATTQNANHTYTAAGVYAVSLTVVDDCGTDTATRLELVRVTDSCSVDFWAEPTSGCAPLDVSFGGLTHGPCEISSWTWNFGDTASGTDNSATGQNVDHTYAHPGVYTVVLTAVDAGGTKVITKTNLVTVHGGPTADFTAAPTSGEAPLTVLFTNLSTSSDGTLTYTWDFGDPGSGADNVSTLEDPSHVFAADGDYMVRLVVSNGCGTDTAQALITVSPAIIITKTVDKPVAPAGEELLYTLTVRNSGGEPIGGIIVSDTIPDSTGYVNGSASPGGLFDSRQDVVSWTIPYLDPGQDVDMSFRVVLDGPFTVIPTVVSNQAVAVIGGQPARQTAAQNTFVSNIVTTTVDIPTGALGIVKEVDVVLASPGDQLTYTITIRNSSPALATGVEILDAVPDSTTLVLGSITNGGVHNSVNDSLHWTIGTLGAFESASVSFAVTVDANVADGQRIPNTALVKSSLGGDQSNEVMTTISLTPLVITKTAGRPSGMIGDFIRFTITIENFSGGLFEDVHVLDTMPAGFFYVAGASLLDGNKLADPVGDNPYDWTLGDLPADGTLKLEYTGLVGASAVPGMVENVARAQAIQGGMQVHSNRAIAPVYVLSQTLTGSIRGKVVVDCDGDGIADSDSVPSGMDVYLDDGSQSRVNEKGMFYFSTVRPGERVVLLDERDLNGYYVPEGAQASVFAHVHESGESYIIFRICPEYPILEIRKKASIIPTVKVTKTARLHPEQDADGLGVLIDYAIDIKSNGLADPTRVSVVDSLPESVELIVEDGQELRPERSNDRLVYQVTAAQERLQKTVLYSLRDEAPGTRRFITNKVHLEGEPVRPGTAPVPALSSPMEVTAGPFLLVPPQNVNITLTPALFITSMADLQEPAFPQLQAVADSIDRYADAVIKVEGHTDYRPIHTKKFPSNWELGEARAKAVVDWLVANRGIERDRLAYESFAATRPVVRTGTTSKELQPNRRTEVIIQARLAGYLAPGVSPEDSWSNSTTLALNPVKFDTLFESSDGPLEIGLDDSWEIVLTVENTSAMAAENPVLSDVLPEGVEYVASSATADGHAVSAAIDGKVLSVMLTEVAPSQMIEVRYRVRALEGHAPSGGGAASVEVRTVTNLLIVQKSNEVRFQ
ncbi:MAG: PKD domain-containing protein [candidate division Zixibacteria bacterium]|nr:PKD domain-containing protein [candidate division Zixibacteria bacterium]